MDTETRNALRQNIAALDAWQAQAERESFPKRCRACYAARNRAARLNPGSFNHGVCCDMCTALRDCIGLNRLRFLWVMKNNARNALEQGDRSDRSFATQLAQECAAMERNERARRAPVGTRREHNVDLFLMSVAGPCLSRDSGGVRCELRNGHAGQHWTSQGPLGRRALTSCPDCGNLFSLKGVIDCPHPLHSVS